MISAKIICDSVNPCGKRLTTFVVKAHRYILAEINTHRSFSRNSASSRAIPIEKIIKTVIDDTAFPIHYGANIKGMQANEQLPPEKIVKVKELISKLRDFSIDIVKEMGELGLHKQVANRYLEPFSYTTILISATDWGNFFNLRAHKDAQPEFQELAKQMLVAYKNNKPKSLKIGEWHLPFTDKHMMDGLNFEQKKKITTARGARVSYINFEGDIDPEKDYKLHDNLLSSGHMSPFEHAAECMNNTERYGNFIGWKQYRKTIPNENREYLDPDYLLAELSK